MYLNIADDYFKAKNRGESLQTEIDNKDKQINDLNKKSFTASYKFDDNWSFSHQHNDSKYSYDQYDKTWSKLTEDANYHYIDDFSRLQYKDDSVSANLFYNRSNRRNQTYNVTGSKWTKSDHLRFDTIGLDLQKQITGKFGDVIVGTTVPVIPIKMILP